MDLHPSTQPVQPYLVVMLSPHPIARPCSLPTPHACVVSGVAAAATTHTNAVLSASGLRPVVDLPSRVPCALARCCQCQTLEQQRARMRQRQRQRNATNNRLPNPDDGGHMVSPCCKLSNAHTVWRVGKRKRTSDSQQSVTCVAFLPDGHTLLSAGAVDGLLKVCACSV